MALVDVKQKVLDVALMMEVLREQLEDSTGDSISVAVKLNRGDVDFAIIWTFGLCHVKKSEAFGFFFYVNDIAPGILKLLKIHWRIVYVDIDIEHRDQSYFMQGRRHS